VAFAVATCGDGFTLSKFMSRLRLLTFNIAHGRGLAPIQGFTSAQKIRVNLRKIAALIGELKPDFVALQEVDERSLWAGNFDHLEYLRLHTGFKHSVFGVHNRRLGLVNLSYGNALLSRFPIVASETVVFGVRRVGEKGFLFAEIAVGARIVPLVNVHLHFSSREHRIRQIGRLLAWLREKQRHSRARWDVPAIVCGDLNNPGTSADATAALLSHLSDYGEYVLHPATGNTFPSPLPGRLLDFIFLPAACSVNHCEIVKCYLSDHRPVVVDFTLP
jgi:endonuclease/exonuclease/phosphatase family metal-dependent hydrolase